MDLNLASVWYHACITQENEVVISGLGPDEYCGCYARFKQQMTNQEKNTKIQEAITAINERNIQRDAQIAKLLGKRFVYPYLNYKVHQEFLFQQSNEII